MRMNWYYRMMLSYTPIFFVVISSVIVVFFTTLNHATENRYIETNKAIVEQIMQNTEANLKLIERNAVSALITDRSIKDFFSDRPKTIYDHYIIQEKLLDLKSSLPLTSSIYLYDEANRRILSDSNAYNLDVFADKTFLSESYTEPMRSEWTSPRDYTLSTIDRNKQKVVSIVKVFPYSKDQKGTMVINVYVSSLMESLNQYSQEDRGTVHIVDAENRVFQTTKESPTNSRLRAVSEYTGWTYYADSVNAAGYSALSLLSNAWVILVMVIIVLALVWFTIITHVHYKPIQALVEKINRYTARKSGVLGIKKPLNEFNFIESAIDQLLAKSVDYDSLHEADTLHRKRILLQELLEGHRTMNDAEWQQKAGPIGLPGEYDRIGVVSIEIDRYPSFVETYKPSDQHLLKYFLESAFRELAQERGMPQSHIWTEPQQMTFILFLTEPHKPYSDALFRLCEDYRSWIHDNLQITVSIGIGAVSDTMETIAESYRNAINNVSYKVVFGTNAVIDNQKAAAKSDNNAYSSFGSIPELVHLYLKGDGQWLNKLSRIIEELKLRKMGRMEITSLAASITQYLEKEICSISPELKRAWHESYRDRFNAMADKAETLGELNAELVAALNDLAVDLKVERESSSNHAIAMRIKAYIDDHYSDPDLSLSSVCDKFGLPVSNASILFKEESGEKFIDYVMRIRLDHGRRMLVETDESIQSIAEKVGYTHVISFHRAFKKQFEFPPGEYRNIYRLQR
ncbi:AraC family transcriptional regulator [Paenibacillus sp. LPE1-1-1.1]|uniref:AraC family transcriptional regulator n=1 Tax=Paenibacillus sp. LPE1-1-1.1 TaxID=3135230 RepID=UPI0034270370